VELNTYNKCNKRLASVENGISELRADIREDGREVKERNQYLFKQKDKNVIHGKNSWLGRKNLHTKGQ